MQKTLTLATAFALWSTAVHADGFTDAVLAKFQDRDFDYIEIKEGLTQVKVEAIRGDQKLEVVYDRATGAILKQEQERADADEIGRSGIEFDRRNRDFLDGDDLARGTDDDDEDDDERRSGRDDEDDDDETSGRGDDENDEDEHSDHDEHDEDDSDDDEDDESDDDDNDEDNDDDEYDED